MTLLHFCIVTLLAAWLLIISSCMFWMHVLSFCLWSHFSKYAVVSFEGYNCSDVVPTKWIVIDGFEPDDCVSAWFPDCHVSQPRKCEKLVRSGKPHDPSCFKKYIVKMLYLTGKLKLRLSFGSSTAACNVALCDECCFFALQTAGRRRIRRPSCLCTKWHWRLIPSKWKIHRRG